MTPDVASLTYTDWCQTAWLSCLATRTLRSWSCFSTQYVKVPCWLYTLLCTLQLNLATSAPNQAAAPLWQKGLTWSGGRKPQWKEKVIQTSTDTTVSAAPPPTQFSGSCFYQPAAAFDSVSVMLTYISCFNRYIRIDRRFQITIAWSELASLASLALSLCLCVCGQMHYIQYECGLVSGCVLKTHHSGGHSLL